MMVTPQTIAGADISHFQAGTLDLVAFKKAGGRFLYHKATESTNYADPNYASRRAQAKKAGIPFGAYHFARPTAGSAAAEGAYFRRIAAWKPGDMLPMLDLEVNTGNLGQAELTSWVETFIAALGITPIIYTHFDLADDFNAHLWVARYSDSNLAPNVPRPWKSWSVWQFSDGVYGAPSFVTGLGRVDLDTLAPGVDVADLQIENPKAKPAKWYRFATSNVCEQPLHYKTISHTISTSLLGNDAVMFQEMADDTYEKHLATEHPRYLSVIEGPVSNDCRISVRKKLFRKVSSGWKQLHPETHGVSRARFIEWMTAGGLESRVRFSSRHYIPRAWAPDGSAKARKNKQEAAEQPARQAEWNDGLQIDLKFLTNTNLPQVAAGDYNRQRVSAYPKRIALKSGTTVRVRSFRHGVDWLHFIDGEDYVWRFPLFTRRRVVVKGTESDHDVLIVKARLVKRK